MYNSDNLQPHPPEGTPQSQPPNDGNAFQRAETLLAVGNERRDERSKETLAAIEDRATPDRPSGSDDSDALTRRDVTDHGNDETHPTADEKLDADLDEKAIEDGLALANDSAETVLEMTPHNL